MQALQANSSPGMFYLGKIYNPHTKKTVDEPLLYSSKNFTTHAVCVGMTGSGKTGLGITVLEEAALSGIPSIIIDPKGDMGNILLTFPELSDDNFKPWIDHGEAERKGQSIDSYAEEVAKTWKEGLQASEEDPKRIQELKDAVVMEIYTPASQAGIPLSILHSFEAPSKEFALDADAMRERVLSTTSSILGLLGISADPLKSREHILVSTIFAKAWKEEKNLDLSGLIEQIQKPDFDKIGVLDIDTFFPSKDRMALSVQLNNLLAAPGFQTWMEGVPLEIEQLLYTSENKPKVSVISIAHLNDSERMFFVTLFLNQLITWMRKQTGTSSLRALFYMDEIFGYFPPTAAPPSKAPMMTLLKQARAYGLGMMLCTQNPVDLDYKGLSNCGTWLIGRLQTARDKLRVTEGLAAASNGEIDAKEIDKLMSEIGNRVFIMRSIYEKEPILFQTRWALSYLRGPLTLAQIELLTRDSKPESKEVPISNSSGMDKAEARPLISVNIPQYFIHPSQNESEVYYRPFIVGFSKLHFVDKKYNIDAWVHSCLVVEALKGESPDWQTAESHQNLRERLSTSPVDRASYQEISSALTNEKKFLSFKQDLFNYLYQNNTLKLFEFKQLKLVSMAEEDETNFRQKVAVAMKVKADDLVQKLREGYDKKIAALKEKIRKAEEKKTTQEQQSFYQKIEAFFSFLTTMIGAFLGKKFTKTTINQAGTTLRRVGRVGKESQEVAQAEETCQCLEQQLQEFSAQLEEERAKILAIADVSHAQLDEVTIRPRKTDIFVEEIALVWWPNER